MKNFTLKVLGAEIFHQKIIGAGKKQNYKELSDWKKFLKNYGLW
jgi:hypothetical protein